MTASEAAKPEAAWPQRVELVSHNQAAFSGHFGVHTPQYLFQETQTTVSFAPPSPPQLMPPRPATALSPLMRQGAPAEENAGF